MLKDKSILIGITGGIAAYDKEIGLQRQIHKIVNSPFRTKFEHVFEDMQGTSAIGCINDGDPQPLLVRSGLGVFAICFIGVISNAQELIEKHMFEVGGHYEAMTGGKINTTELVAALINQKKSFAEGIRYAQGLIEGTASILILKEDGHLIAARDFLGRLPILIGKGPEGHRDRRQCRPRNQRRKLGQDLVPPGSHAQGDRRHHRKGGRKGLRRQLRHGF